MIVDVTGTILVPGNGGRDCPGNGESGECCCDECDYLLCCFGGAALNCEQCTDRYCPKAKK